MSYSPCCNCRNTVGRLSYFYLAAFNGEEKLNYRLRLCAECALSLVSDLINIADRKGPDGMWRSSEWWG